MTVSFRWSEDDPARAPRDAGPAAGRSSPRAGLAARWDRFWFAPASPEPLALCRIAFFAWLLVWIAPGARTRDWAQVSPAFWMPTHLFAVLHLEPASREVLGAIDAAWSASLALASLGLWTRASTLAAFLLGVYVLGLPQCFGKIDHWSGLLLLVLLVLACARCADAWSLDVWRAARRGARTNAWSGEYRWPIQLVRVTMVLVFFAAGVAKLRFGGSAWLTPDNMAAILVQPHYALDRALPPVGLAIASLPLACSLLGVLTVVAETAAPLALVGRLPAAAIVGTLFAMQLGIAVLLGVHASFPYLGCYAFWLPRLRSPGVQLTTRLSSWQSG